MKYELKIEGATEEQGTINLHRLALISEAIRKVAEGALQVRLRGISFTKGRKKISLEDALNVTLSGLRPGSTCLDLETKPFAETLESYQMDIFRQDVQKDLQKYTPVSLFMDAYREATKDDPVHDLLDKPLIKELKKLKQVLSDKGESLTLTNQGTIETVTINNETFNKIKELEDDIPNPKPVIIKGKVELLKFSKQRVTIQTEEGLVDGFLSDVIAPESIAPFWGKEITIAGTAHFKPGGKSVIEIERLSEPSGDDYFSKKPKSATIAQQLENLKRQGKKPNPLADIIGKWPGDETDEEFEEMLKNLD